MKDCLNLEFRNISLKILLHIYYYDFIYRTQSYDKNIFYIRTAILNFKIFCTNARSLLHQKYTDFKLVFIRCVILYSYGMKNNVCIFLWRTRWPQYFKSTIFNSSLAHCRKCALYNCGYFLYF